MEKTLQRILSFALAVLMVFSYVPTTAFATGDVTIVSGSEDAAATEAAATVETEAPTEETKAPTEETEASTEETEAPIDEAAVQAFIDLVEALPTTDEIAEYDLAALEELSYDFDPIEKAYNALSEAERALAEVDAAWNEYLTVVATWDAAWENAGENPVDDLADANETDMAPQAYAAYIGETGYTSLAEAVASANSGDSIVLHESVASMPAINKPLTIKGVTENAGIQVNCAIAENFPGVDGTVTFENLTFNDRISTENASNDQSKMTLKFVGCTFNIPAGNTYAIQAGASWNNDVLGTLVVEDCTFTTAATSFVKGYMVYAQCVENVTVTGSTLDGNNVFRGAIHLGDSTDYATVATIQNNTIKNFARGVQVGNRVEGSELTVSGNTFENVAPITGETESATVYIHEVANAETTDIAYTNNEVGDSLVIFSENATGAVTDFVTTFTGNTANETAIELEGNYNDTVYVPETSAVSGTFNGGHMNLKDSTEIFITTEISNLNATESVVVKIYSGETMIATTTLQKSNLYVSTSLTVKTCLTGSSSSWSTVWEEGMPRADLAPTSGTLYVDGQKMNSAEIKMRDTADAVVDWATLDGVNPAPAAGPVEIDLSKGSYTIETAGKYVVSAYTGSNTLTIKADAIVELKGVNITAAEGVSAISIESGNVTLNVAADSTLTGGKGGAGVYVAESASVTVKGSKLTAIGNGGADTSDSGAAGIGGTYANGASGAITIDGATVVAKGYGVHGSGIGSGSGKVVGEIKIINNANVTAQGGYYANGTGTQLQSNYGKSDPEGGAAIGGGGKTASTIANITITDSTVVANGGSKAAGIGANFWSSVGTITISGNSNVTAQGGSSSAGIGTSRAGDTGVSSDIVISGGTVNATGGAYGAGIGAGYNADSLGNGADASALPETSITISGGNVTATGGEGGAGIGGGYKSDNVDIDITGGTVTATAGALVSGKTVENGGAPAAIGSGANGSGVFENSPEAEVAEAATVTVTAYEDGKPAIEGMTNEEVKAMENVTLTETANPNKVEVATYEELVAALTDGTANIKLTADIVAPDKAVLTIKDQTLDLGGKTLTLNGESGKLENATIKNGTIEITTYEGDTVADGMFDVYGSTVIEGVKFHSDAFALYAILDLKSGDTVLNNVTMDMANNTVGGDGGLIFFNGGEKLTMNNCTVTGTDVGDFISNGTVEMNNCAVTLKGTVEKGLDNGINGTALTLNDTTVTIDGATGRGITTDGDNIAINGTSVVTLTNCGEGGIRYKASATITVADTASLSGTVKVDAAATEAKINDTTVAVTSTELPIVTVENGTVTVKVTPAGDIQVGYLSAGYVNGVAAFYGEAINVVGTESFVVKLYNGVTLVGTAELVDTNKVLINGKSQSITWHAALTDDGDSWWNTTWNETLNVNNIPNRVELWVDGKKVSEGNVELNINDQEKPIVAAVTDADGNVQSFVAGTGYLNGTGANAPVYNDALQAAFTAGGNIVMLRDVTAGVLTVGADMTLDLNGHTVNLSQLKIDSDITVEVKNGTLVGTSSSDDTIRSEVGNLTLTDVNVSGLRHTVRIKSGAATINGGTYTYGGTSTVNSTLNVINVGDDEAPTTNIANVTIKGGTFIAGYPTTSDGGSAVKVQKGSTVTIEGGSFSNGYTTLNADEGATLSVTGGTYDQDPSAYAAEGYEAVEQADGTYTVKVTLPEVEITDIKSSLKDSDPDLTFALNFAIKDIENLSEEYLEELMATYGSWYTDYVLTISGLTDEEVVFNANGNADGYLAGQYDAWSENWVSVPFENVTVKNGESLYIMEYAAKLMNQSGLRYTLAEVAAIVQNFDCGVYFTPEFLAANPDMEVTLELKVFTENTNGDIDQEISVATNEFDLENITAVVTAKNKQTKYCATVEEAFNAAAAGDEVVILKAGTYALSTSGKDITITGAVDGVVFDNIGAKNMGGANVTFNNVTFDYYPNVDYTGLQHSGNLVYNNCTINGQVFLYGASETFNICTFNQNSANAYNVWTYGADKVTFKECTFNSAGKSVLVYNEADGKTDLTVIKSTFNASASVEGKAAIEIDTTSPKKPGAMDGTTITIDGETTATGFANGSVSDSSLWNDKMDQTNLTVTVDNVKVWPIAKATIGHGLQTIISGTAGTADYREAVTTSLNDVYAADNLTVKIYAGETLLGTTIWAKDYPVVSSELTVNNVITGKHSSSWTTTWEDGVLTFENVPTKIEVYTDGTLADTYVDAEGAFLYAQDKTMYQALFAVASITTDDTTTYYGTLEDALAANDPSATVVLLKDVSADEIITISGAVVIDGAGHTLTSTANRAINIDTTAEVTIKDLAIVGDTGCERGINIINQAGTTNLNNVTVSNVSHYAVHVATSAGAANVKIEGGEYTGYAALAIYGAGTIATVNDAKLIGKNPYNGESNAYGTVVTDADNVKLTVTGGSVSAECSGDQYQSIIANNSGKTGVNVTLNTELILGVGNTKYSTYDAGENTLTVRAEYADELEAEGYVTKDAGNGLVSVHNVVASITAGRVTYYYASLAEAVADAKNGETVTLLSDITPEATIVIDKSVNLDLNGHTITGTGTVYRPLKVTGNNADLSVTISNGTIETKDVTYKSTNASALLVYDGADVTLENVILNGSNYAVLMAGYNSYSNGVATNNTTSLILNSGAKLTAENAAIIEQGSYPNTYIEINEGAEVTSTGTIAMYLPTKGDRVINGGTITGETGIVIKAGSLTVNGGTITASGDKADHEFVDSGANSTGDGIVVESCNYGSYGAPVVNIKGGKITSENGEAVVSYAAEGYEVVTGIISGGTFSSDVTDLCAEGYEAVKNDNGLYGIAEKSVAYIGEVGYETLQEAVNAVAEGGTIKLAADCSNEMVFVNKQLTIQKNGFVADLYAGKDSSKQSLKVTEYNDYYVVELATAGSTDNGPVAFYVELDSGTSYTAGTETLMTLQEALDEASKTASETNIMYVRLDDDYASEFNVGTIIIPSYVVLDIEAHTLAADRVIGLTGSKLMGTTVNSEGTTGGVLKIEKDNLLLAKDAVVQPNSTSGDQTILPVWLDDHYIFSLFVPVNLAANPTLTFEDGEIYAIFRHNASGYVNKKLLMENGGKPYGVHVVINLTWEHWQDDEFISMATQTFTYTEEMVKTVATNKANYTFRLANFEEYGINPETLKVTAQVITDCGAVATSSLS